MNNFVFRNQTKIIFGKDVEKDVAKYVQPHARKVLLHYGGGSIKKSGLYNTIVEDLKSAGIMIYELGGVQPNPRLSLVQEGIVICQKYKIDFILAVGGGSVIDSAKAIALGVRYEGDVWDLFEGKPIDHPILKVGVVLTIPAAGSESSTSCVITNEKLKLKKSAGSQKLRPTFSLLNPELTYTLPPYQTACGIADMFCHICERYFTNTQNVDVTDYQSEGVMKAIIENAPLVLANPTDYASRAEIMLAGYVAHNDTLQLGRETDWASHDLEHELSAIYDIAHGAGLAIIHPAWMKYVYKHDVKRFARFATNVFNIKTNPKNLEATALKGIEALEAFYASLNLATHLSQVEIDDSNIETMAKKLVNSYGTVGSFVKVGYDEAVAIYQLAL